MEKMSWEEKIDSKNFIFVKIHFKESSFEIVDIVVPYFAYIDDELKEIVRFDGSTKEKSNIHRFYLLKKQKKYLNYGLSLESVEAFIFDIKKNWFVYRMRFNEKD